MNTPVDPPVAAAAAIPDALAAASAAAPAVTTDGLPPAAPPDSACDPAPDPATTYPADPWAALRRHTPARLALGRAGMALPTAEVLRFAAAHALARDAVHVPLDARALQARLEQEGWATLAVHSRATDRATYLRRPDWGRRLDEASLAALGRWRADHRIEAGGPAGPIPAAEDAKGEVSSSPPGIDLAVVLADGLSAVAVERHAPAVLAALKQALDAGPGDDPGSGPKATLRWSPIVIARQARVALADEVGERLGARLALILIGERPGLSSPDSLGAYLTHAPRVGCHDAQRNCVSNIRPEGLPPVAAAHRLAWLIRESLRLGLTGVGLKDNSAVGLIEAVSLPVDGDGRGS